MRISFKYLSFLLLVALMLPLASSKLHAEETRLLIRVKANDAMFIGTLMGGAYVQVKDARSGEVLADGRTMGRVGNFVRVMKIPLARGVRLSEEETAAFTAVLDISSPTFVEVAAYGPDEYGRSEPLGTTKLWLLPGVHIEKEGLIMELSGLLVDVASPRSGRHHLADLKDGELTVRANVAMLCGCPITPEMYWDSADFTVKAYLRQHGKLVAETSLLWVSESAFNGTFSLVKPGPYEIEIVAYEHGTPNTGVAKTHIMVRGNTSK